MTDPYIDHEENRFGSAELASRAELAAAGLFGNKGLPLGYSKGKMIRLDGDAPLLTIGGAGSGKLRDLLGYSVCANAFEPMLINDPRGELAAISIHGLAEQNIKAYCWNPVGLCDLPQHGCNPLDILIENQPSFFADIKFIMEGLIPLTGSANGKYFELRARDFGGALMAARVEQNGFTSLPDFWRTLQKIDGDPNGWADQLEFMLQSKHESIRAAASEMLTKQQDSPKEFSGIVGELHACTSFLGDPVLRHSLEDGFSLKELVHAE